MNPCVLFYVAIVLGIALCIWNMGRDTSDINCSPHLDGFMDASSTLPPIPLGFLNLTTSEKGDIFVIQKEHECVDGQDTSCAVHSAPSIGEGETSPLLFPYCHPSAGATSIKHESQTQSQSFSRSLMAQAGS